MSEDAIVVVNISECALMVSSYALVKTSRTLRHLIRELRWSSDHTCKIFYGVDCRLTL